MDDEPRKPADQDEVDAVERGDAEPEDHAKEAERAAKREEEAAEG